MALLEWLPEYELGHPEIDSQHRKWFQLTSIFLKRAYAGEAKPAVIEKALSECVGYARYHFDVEEEFMRSMGYAERSLKAHLAMHDAFVERINTLAARCRAGDRETAQEMIQFLTDWLRQHILETDVKYIRFHKRQEKSMSKQKVERLRRVTRRRMG